jgi:probable HAF family extracellular repeat protein
VTRAQIPCEYEVTAIIQAPECPPFGFPATNAWGLNEQGWVVGSFNSCVIGPDVAWLWTPELGMQVIPMPAGTSYSKAVAISRSLIVGEYDNGQLELGRTGFLYDFETDQFTSLGTLPGGDWSEAHAINSSGEIVGFWGNTVNGPSPLAFIWHNGEMIDINGDFGTLKSEANDINPTGLVTGWMGSSPLTDARAFIWDDGKVTRLPEIPGGTTSEGEAINAYEDVTGRGRFFDPRLNATVWRAFAYVDGQAFRLDPLPGPSHSSARDINNAQTVVGGSNSRAFIWQDGLLMDLNDLVPSNFNLTFHSARSINETGQITGQATSPDGPVAFVLTPIEPRLGDLDGDCQVGVADLLILLGNWGRCDICANCPADLNSDCVVGAVDLLILLVNWG